MAQIPYFNILDGRELQTAEELRLKKHTNPNKNEASSVITNASDDGFRGFTVKCNRTARVPEIPRRTFRDHLDTSHVAYRLDFSRELIASNVTLNNR